MYKSLSTEEIRVVLESGKFDELIGVIESPNLECKGSPYQLTDDHQKQELAKDVSAFANANGGVILLGVKTRRNPSHFGDEIKEINAFPQNMIDPESYQKTLQSQACPN